MTPIFAADSIGKRFGAREVLKGASFWARAGRITVILGRNGCGKSTLLRIAAGVLSPDFGVVHFAGRAFMRPRLNQLARAGLFYLPDRDLLSRRLTLRQHVEAVHWRFGDAGDTPAFSELRIDCLAEKRVDTLSGGERRRAEFALAALRRPLCLLADEPLAGIGPTDAEAISRSLRELARSGAAIVISGHEVEGLLDLADEVIWMTAGTTHGLGRPEAAAAHEQFRREYLGPRAPRH